MSDLDFLNNKIKYCQLCPLSKELPDYVEPLHIEDKRDSNLLVVLDQPSLNNMILKDWYVGTQAQYFKTFLQSCGVKSYNTTYAVKCFSEKKCGAKIVTSCSHWLLQEIEILRPKLIIAVGKMAMNGILGNKYALQDYKNQVVKYKEFDVLPIVSMNSLFELGKVAQEELREIINANIARC